MKRRCKSRANWLRNESPAKSGTRWSSRSMSRSLRSGCARARKRIWFGHLSNSHKKGWRYLTQGQLTLTAIGVAVKRWVAYHGFAINVNTHLAHFTGIIPCGINAAEGSVTSLQAELGRSLDLLEVKSVLAAQFSKQWPAFIQ